MPDIKFSNQYPYTDFHELNLDWVIKEVKFWSERVGKSIQTIEKTGTAGLVDTYTITYSDGSTSTFDVTNGNGISSVIKVATAGLVDTYSIRFQDGSSTSFDVTNGTASIDPTLTLQNYAADAKATGDALSDLRTAIETGTLITRITGFDNYTGRRQAGAVPYTDYKSCTTTNMITFKTGNVLHIASGYKVCFVFSDGTYAGAWTSGDYTLLSDFNAYVEVRNTAATNLTPAEVDAMPTVLYIESYSAIEDGLSKKIVGICYVATTGSDSNDGTKTSPFATVTHAITEGYKNICVFNGTYNEAIDISNTNDINIFAYDYMAFGDFPNIPRERPTFTNGTVYTSFTPSGSYRTFALGAAPARYTEVFVTHTRPTTEVINGRVKNAAGLWANFSNPYNDKQLKPVLTVADLSEPDTFTYDGTTVYFNTDAGISGVTVVGDAVNVAYFGQCDNLKISGINFTYGFYRDVYIPFSNNVTIIDCDFGYSTQSQASEFTMTDVHLTNCVGYKAGLDGFNASYYGIMRLTNCKGIYNLDDGASSHEYCELIVEGGEYSNNGKGGLAPVHGCRFNCSGAYIYDNVYGLYMIASAGYSLEKLIVTNTAVKNNTTDVINTLYDTYFLNVVYGTISGSVTDLNA